MSISGRGEANIKTKQPHLNVKTPSITNLDKKKNYKPTIWLPNSSQKKVRIQMAALGCELSLSKVAENNVTKDE